MQGSSSCRLIVLDHTFHDRGGYMHTATTTFLAAVAMRLTLVLNGNDLQLFLSFLFFLVPSFKTISHHKNKAPNYISDITSCVGPNKPDSYLTLILILT